MRVKVKIVSLLAVLGMALTPFPHLTCTTGACHHAKAVSASMPCHHAMETSNQDEALQSASDHSCCRLLPALPTASRQLLPDQKFEQDARFIVSEAPGNRATPGHPVKVSQGDSPPRTLLQSLSCALLL